jgi:hypothetical protein
MSDLFQYLQPDNIKLGLWTNWSRGPVLGVTLTLTQKHGAYLTSFLALLVTYTGGCFWKIACLLMHRALSSENAKDGVYHQRQAILRNSGSGADGLWRFLQICWAWRKHPQSRIYRRNIGLLSMSAVITAIFAAGSILSSQIANSMGNEVLISSPHCCWWNTSKASNTDRALIFKQSYQDSAADSRYADFCYHKNATRGECQIYPKSRLRYNITRDIECPFPGGNAICLESSGAIRLDSGYINSHDDLGVNAKPEHRFLWRTTVECAPLKLENYSVIESDPNPNSTDSFKVIGYQYGPLNMVERVFNYTYVYRQDHPTSYKDRLKYARRSYEMS